ncbi:MAG: ATP-binding cassette domain-containing protein [Deltaproteobacteria bacterium]|nr:ATP-binding cassette domain-containing protein [Deltaproteobacteria bacterium]
MSRVVEIKGVSCRLMETRTVIDNIDLTLSSGEKVLIAAPPASGWGLALIGLASGLIRPDTGVINLFGVPLSGLDKARLNAFRKRIGFVFQDAALISNLKAIENAALPLLYHSEFSYAGCLLRAAALLEDVGFKEDLWALPGPLPVHAKKEVAIAAALSLGPEAILCDNLADTDLFKPDRVLRVEGSTLSG